MSIHANAPTTKAAMYTVRNRFRDPHPQVLILGLEALRSGDEAAFADTVLHQDELWSRGVGVGEDDLAARLEEQDRVVDADPCGGCGCAERPYVFVFTGDDFMGGTDHKADIVCPDCARSSGTGWGGTAEEAVATALRFWNRDDDDRDPASPV